MKKTTWTDAAAEDADDKDLVRLLEDEVNAIEESPTEKARRGRIIRDLELFYGERIASLNEVSWGAFDDFEWDANDLTFNVTAAITMATTNWVCSFNPRADFAPSNGDYKLLRGCKDMRQSCDAWMDDNKIYEEREFMMRDVLTSDAGVIKLWSDGKKIHAARFPSWEFLVSRRQGRYRKPPCLYHVRWIPIEEAVSEYAKDEGDEHRIRLSSRTSTDGISYGEGGDIVRVIDAYDRADGDDAGHHVILAGGLCALREPWKWEGHPAVVKRYEWKGLGYWGKSSIHFIRGIQIALNDATMAASEAHDMSSHQVAVVDENDPGFQTTDEPVRIYKTAAGRTPPNFLNPPAMGRERYEWIELLKRSAYETLGIPENLAQGMAQRNLESGEALRESVEVKSDRISKLVKMNEDIIVEVADWWRKLSSELPPQKWQVIDRGMLKTVETPRIAENVAVRVLPTSLFGNSKSARIDKAFEFVDRGILTQEDAFRAVDVPDLEPVTNLRLSEANLREQTVDDILQDNKLEWPPETMDPKAMYEYAKRRHYAALCSGVKFPMENLASLCKLIDAYAAMIKAAEEKTSAAAATVPPPPPGMMPPPQGGTNVPPSPGGAPMDPALMPPPPAVPGAPMPGAPPPLPPMPPALPPTGTGGPPVPLQ